MADITADQLFYVQLQSGIGTGEGVLTDAQVNTIFSSDEMGGGSLGKTVLIILRAIAADAARLNDYRIAQSSESLSQVYKQVKDLIDYWEEQVQGGDQQIYFGSFRTVPPVERKRPADGRNRTNRGYKPYDPD